MMASFHRADDAVCLIRYVALLECVVADMYGSKHIYLLFIHHSLLLLEDFFIDNFKSNNWN